MESTSIDEYLLLNGNVPSSWKTHQLMKIFCRKNVASSWKTHQLMKIFC